MSSAAVLRCTWSKSDLMIEYHDREWGVPLHDDQMLFEFLLLDGAQAGLSWETILRKREGYREAFDGFDATAIAAYGEDKIAELLNNPGIVRNRLKVRAFITNAQAYLTLQEQSGGLDAYLWDFVSGTPVRNAWIGDDQVPAKTELSDNISADLKRRGFKFVGSTICYAFLQAAGLVNDHLVTCFRYQEVDAL
jgi:DNA-3-methyladenine glycosylase I